MYSLVLHGRRFLELQKWRNVSLAVSLFQNESAFSSSFSSASVAADVTPRDGRKGKNFTVSYLVKSLGLATKVAESISRRVSFMEKGNPDSVLNLFRSHGFTVSQISNMVEDYPRLLIADAEKTLAPKLQFLQSIGASSYELTEIISTVPKILGKKEGKAISRYYFFVKEIIEADKSCKFENLCQSFPQGKQENKLRNVSALRELGMPQKLLFSMLLSNFQTVSGKERFEESLKKVVELGFDPTTSKFVQALNTVYQMSNKTIEGKVNVVCKRLGFGVGDVWEMFKKHPSFLTLSEKKITNTAETFLGLGFTRDEFMMIAKGHPSCFGLSAGTVKKKIEFLVKKMNWPLNAVVLYPTVLGFSMEKRLVPRYKVLKALMSKGFLVEDRRKLPPMQSALRSTDEDFLSRYVRKHDDKEVVAELMAIFTGDCAS